MFFHPTTLVNVEKVFLETYTQNGHISTLIFNKSLRSNSICKNQTLTADRLMQSPGKDKFVWNFKKETFIVRSSATDISYKYLIFS